jgi:arginine-tRNA-protein transferase
MTIHGKAPDNDGVKFLLEDGGIAGGELHARDSDGQLMAVSVVDVFDDALSSVYCYYDPSQSRRSLGTFMILSEIAHCQAQNYRWLYLGFLVHGCRKMIYKARFLPHEVLDDDKWQRSE